MDRVFREEIEIDQFDKTQKINFELTSKRYSESEVIFTSNIDGETGAIVITPESPEVVILEAAFASSTSVEGTTINEDGTVTTIYPLEIHMMGENESDFEVTINVDEIGQAIILPVVSTTQIISAIHADNVELITEANEANVTENSSSETTNNTSSEENSEEETDKQSTSEKPEEKPQEQPKEPPKEKEIPEVEAKVVNESLEIVEPPVTEGDEPYDRETIESILMEITDNFSSSNGVVKCGFDEEKNIATDILKSNNYYFDVVPNGDWHIISYAKYKEPVKESYNGTFDENKELATIIVDDIQKLVQQLVLKTEKLSELFTCINLNLETVENFRSIVSNLECNSFDNVSVQGLRDELQRGFV